MTDDGRCFYNVLLPTMTNGTVLETIKARTDVLSKSGRRCENASLLTQSYSIVDVVRSVVLCHLSPSLCSLLTSGSPSSLSRITLGTMRGLFIVALLAVLALSSVSYSSF